MKGQKEALLRKSLEFADTVISLADRDVDTLRASDALYHLGELAKVLKDRIVEADIL